MDVSLTLEIPNKKKRGFFPPLFKNLLKERLSKLTEKESFHYLKEYFFPPTFLYQKDSFN